MKFIRIIIAYLCIGIFSILFILLLYPTNFILGIDKPSVKKYIKYLKGVLLEGKSMGKVMKPNILSKDKSAEIRYKLYYKKWANTQEFSSSLLYVTSSNYENIIKTANIPESVKEEIKGIVEDGDGVLISEAAFTSKWKYREKYVVIESFDKKPPKVKYMHKMMYKRFGFFPWLNLKQEIKLGEYYRKYNSMKKPLLYPVVQVDKENEKELLPVLDIPEDIKKDIEQLVNNSKIVVITEAAFQPEWKWEEKYLVFDKKKT